MKISSLKAYSCTRSEENPNKLNSLNFRKTVLSNYADTVSFGHSKDISIVGKLFKDKIKIVFADIDGTLSEYSDIITKNTLGAVNKLHSNQTPVILTTARCYKDTMPIIEQFAYHPDYTILLQGGEIIDKYGKVLLKNKISSLNGKKLINWSESLKEKGVDSQLIMYFDDEAYSTGTVKFPWETRCQINQIDSFKNLLKNQTLQKAMLYVPLDTQSKASAKRILSSFNHSNFYDLDLKFTDSGFHEIQNKSVSKDKAIDFILKRLDINPKNTMAIGDSSNDIEMLDYIRARNGLAIAMGNADEGVKLHANAVTKDIKEDGFAYAVSQLF